MNHAVHRRSHEALMRKRRAEEAEKRQFDLPIFTDPFPPIFPGRPRPTPDPPVIIEEPPIVIRPTPTPPTIPTRPPPVIIEDPETSSTPSGILISTRSSSSSSSTLPTTSSTPSAVPTTSSTPPPPPPPAPVTSARETESEKLPLVTITSYVRSSSAGAAAASGTVEAAGSTASAPAIAGGVMGGLVGLGAIAFFVVFLLRRRKQRDQDMSFDPYDFRRSAMQVPEPKDFNDAPPPSGGQPQMTERALPMPPQDNYGQYNNNNADYGYNNQQMSPYPQGQYPAGGAPYQSYGGDASPGGNMAGYGAGNMAGAGAAQWAPGQIITSSPGMASHYASNPFMNPAPYNESPFTPTGSPAPHAAASRVPPPGPIQIDTGAVVAGANLARTPSTPSTASTSHYPVGFPISPVEGSGKSLSRAPSLSRSRSRTGTNLSRSNTLNNTSTSNLPNNGTVLAEIGGAAVLTRTTSQKSSHEGHHHKKDLSIAVPAPFNVHNIQAINTPTSAALPPHTQPSHHHHLLSAPRADADAPVTAQSADDYVDLTRASVSPFQAAQYAEISKRLNTDVPSGMEVTPPMLEQYVSVKQTRELPPLPPPSPLAPAPAGGMNAMNGGPSLYPAAVVAVGGGAMAMGAKLATPAQARVRDSKDSLNRLSNNAADLASFPIPPPSPLVPPPSFGTTTSPTRVDSRPPRLPEIAFRNSTGMGMSSGWVDTPPSSLNGHDQEIDLSSPISPVSPQRGKAESSLGHGTTFEYHKSFTGASHSAMGGGMSLGGGRGLLGGEDKEVGPAFPSGISALGGLASPMNSRFNLGVPSQAQLTPAAAVPTVAQPTRVEHLSVPPSPTTSSLPSTRVSSTSTVVDDDQVQPKKMEKSPLKSELVVVGGVEGDEGGKGEGRKRPETVYDYEDAYGGF